MKVFALASLVGLGAAAPRTFLQLTDVHLDQEYGSVCDAVTHPFGTQGWTCDSPEKLVDSAMAFIMTLDPKPDFVLWSGDSHRHPPKKAVEQGVYKAESELLQNSIKDVGRKLKVLNIPVAPGVGNNDLPVHNQLGPPPNDVVNLLTEAFSAYLDKGEQKRFLKRGGYYSRKLGGRMSLLTLNTNYWIKSNHAAPHDCHRYNSVAAKQMRWFKNKLKQAKKNRQKVIVSGHHPPGKLYKSACFQSFLDLHDRFSKQVVGGMYGHYHNDDFHVLKHEDNNKPAGIAWQAPSVEASFNPSLRVWKYDPEKGSLLDYDQYFSDFTSSDKNLPRWALEYSAKKAYGLKDMSPKSWNKLLKKIVTKPSGKHAQLYETHKTVSSGKASLLEEWRQNDGTSFLQESFDENHDDDFV